MQKLNEDEVIGTNATGCILRLARNEFSNLCDKEGWRLQRVERSLVAYGKDNLTTAIFMLDNKKAAFFSTPIRVRE